MEREALGHADLADRPLPPRARGGPAVAASRAARLALATLLLLLLAACAPDLDVGKSGRVEEAHVTRVLEEGARPIPGAAAQRFQRLELQLDTGLYRGERSETEWAGLNGTLNDAGLLRPGDRVLVARQDTDQGRTYAISEVERFPALAPFAVALAVLLVAVARWKGVASIAGLAVSLTAFLVFVVPAVRRGDDPLVAALAAALAALVVSVYVVHGPNRKSTAALAGAVASLAAVAALAVAGLRLAHLTGLGTEELVFLSVSTEHPIDMTRLALAGMIVGSLGALVDMSVGQASATFELAAVDRTLRGRALYGRALNVGNDHIGSLVNTLAFAYFGGALPLVALLSVGNVAPALGLNSETVTLSVLSVLVASVGLVLCVPLTTLIAVRLAPSAAAGRARRSP